MKLLLAGPFAPGVEIVGRWFHHNHSRSAAALAFYSLFSLVPLLVVSTKLAGMIIGAEAARREIGMASALFLDEKSSAYLLEMVAQQSGPGPAGWTSLVAFGVLVITASKVVVELRDVLSIIFGKRERTGRRAWFFGLLLDRGVPLLLILSLGVVIAISSLLGAILHFVSERYGLGYSHLEFWKPVERWASIAIVTAIFTFVLRWLPPAPPSFRAAASGALVAGLLLGGLRHLMSVYFENAVVATAYGAAVTLVVVLLWIYFSVQIFFLGAETAGYLQRKHAGK